MSEAFSAIVITGELVFPEVMVGMIEASTTRRASTVRAGHRRPPRRDRSLSDLRNSANSIFEALGDLIDEQVVH
jgi:hypothetical protein